MSRAEMWTHVGFFLAGGAFGGGATFIIFNNRNKAAYQRQVEEELISIEESYLRRIRDLEERLGAKQSGVISEVSVTDEGITVKGRASEDSYAEIIRETGYALNPEDLPKVTREDLIDYRGEEPVLLTTTPEAVEEAVNEYENSVPFLISLEQFMSDETPHEAVTLTYYSVDDVLLDEREQVIRDIEQTVGRENLSKFGENSHDENTVYIRNDKKLVDIELVRIQRSYAQEVLGLEEYDDKPTPRKNGRMREDD